MGAYNGNYSRSNDPEAMFDEQDRYVAALHRPGTPVVDADVNQRGFSVFTQMRRIIENAIGNGSPNNGFQIAESSSTNINNFEIRGGDGTDDGAGRLFQSGFTCMLKSDTEYSDGVFAALQAKLNPQITALAATVLTDSTANWAVNEHAGKTLTPNISSPGTTFTILSNTATTITVTAGDMTVGASINDFYRIELSTPSGADRDDEVYLDIFLDEVDDTEDTDLVHTDLTPNQSAAFRLVIRQFIRVKEGGTTPAGHVDLDGRQHYTVHLATLNRLDGDNTVTTAMIVDQRDTVQPGGAKQLKHVIQNVTSNGQTVFDLGEEADGPFLLYINEVPYSNLWGWFTVSTTTFPNDTWTWQDLGAIGQLSTGDRLMFSYFV